MRHRRSLLLAFSAVLVVACSGGGDTTIDITHDPCSGVTLRAASADTAQLAGIDDAIGLWGELGVMMARIDDVPTIEIVFEHASPAVRGLYDDETGTILINDALTSHALAIVVAHELGHAFGLAHVTGRTSLMNPGNVDQPPTDADAEALAALWGRCDQAMP